MELDLNIDPESFVTSDANLQGKIIIGPGTINKF